MEKPILEEVQNYKSERELHFRTLLTKSGSELDLARV